MPSFLSRSQESSNKRVNSLRCRVHHRTDQSERGSSEPKREVLRRQKGLQVFDASMPKLAPPPHAARAETERQMPTLEHQIVNIRHIQHHAGALASRLRR